MKLLQNTLTLWDRADLLELDKLDKKENTIPILTIGYEGYSIDDFIDRLKAFDVGYLFDVREIPFSRKKGFSKTPLKEALEENDINYHNFKELGSPKRIRDKLHVDKDYQYFFEEYEKYLETQDESLEIVSTAISENKNIHFCLLCFEKDPSICHRSILAKKLSNLIKDDVEIINI